MKSTLIIIVVFDFFYAPSQVWHAFATPTAKYHRTADLLGFCEAHYLYPLQQLRTDRHPERQWMFLSYHSLLTDLETTLLQLLDRLYPHDPTATKATITQKLSRSTSAVLRLGDKQWLVEPVPVLFQHKKRRYSEDNAEDDLSCTDTWWSPTKKRKERKQREQQQQQLQREHSERRQSSKQRSNSLCDDIPVDSNNIASAVHTAHTVHTADTTLLTAATSTNRNDTGSGDSTVAAGRDHHSPALRAFLQREQTKAGETTPQLTLYN